jgi:uncharacterized protein (DUF433 family)
MSTRLEQLRDVCSNVLASGETECVHWWGGKQQGYGTVYVGNRRAVGAHVIACEMRNGPKPAGTEAAHFCGVRDCVNPFHLRWATSAENAADRLIHGTELRGDRSPSRKLSSVDVAEIRRMHAADMALGDIARAFGISRTQVCCIAGGRSWKHLPSTGHRIVLRGQRHPMSKLDESTVRKVLRLHAQGAKQKDLAAMFGLSKQHVSRIVRGERWQHLKAAP